MLLPFGLSASPAGQLLYLTLRVSLVKSAFLAGARRDDAHLTKLDLRLDVSAFSQPVGQLLYLIPLALLVKSAVCDLFGVFSSTLRQLSRSGIPS